MLSITLMIAVFICAASHKVYCSKSIGQALSDKNPILLGDSHAAQMDLTNVHEISSEGSSLFIPLQFLMRYRAELPKEKILLISVWHQNIMAKSEDTSMGISSATHSLKMFAETSTILGLPPLSTLKSFRSKLLYFCGFLGIHRNILDGSGTCFEGQLNEIPEPNLNTERGNYTKVSAIEEINRIAQEDNLRILWIISPEIQEISQRYISLNQQLDSLLKLNSSHSTSVLDLRELNLPLDNFRDEHHINCKPKALIDSLVNNTLQRGKSHALQLP